MGFSGSKLRDSVKHNGAISTRQTRVRNSGKITVAHFRSEYLRLSETFIYHCLTHGHYVRNVVITQQRLPTVSHYPFSRLYCLSDSQVRWTWPWFLALLDRRLWRRDPVEGLLRRHRVALIHAHFGFDGCWALPWAQALDVPLVTSFYGFDASRQPFLDRWHARYHRLFEQGHLFLVEGNRMRQRLVDLGCPHDKIHLQRISIDVHQVPFRERFCAGGEPVKILFCGRLVEKKGLEYALHALAEVTKMGLPAQMRIVGDGELRPRVEQLITDLDIAESVQLVGYIPYARLPQELLAAHILIAPSVTAQDGDSEGGAPTILLDAQASGLPILATRHSDIPEIVLDGESGYLVPERDVAALTERLAFLVTHPELWPGLGRAGRKHVEAHHDVRALVPKLEGKYLELLGRTPRTCFVGTIRNRGIR